MRPEWLDSTNHLDWLMNGYPIRTPAAKEQWELLQWDKAYADMGPSPSGNLGPYWHVPLIWEGDELVYRLYPKIIQGRWLPVIRQAIRELADKKG